MRVFFTLKFGGFFAFSLSILFRQFNYYIYKRKPQDFKTKNIIFKAI